MRKALQSNITNSKEKKKNIASANSEQQKSVGKLSQIKSRKRVKEKGEVFTNEREIKAMCDLIPKDIWNNINSTFLEPTCGNGNFLVEILSRKLNLCKNEQEVLLALKSIYAIDIMPDNVAESKQRLRQMVFQFMPNCDINKVDSILDSQIICGNSLEIMKKLEKGE